MEQCKVNIKSEKLRVRHKFVLVHKIIKGEIATVMCGLSKMFTRILDFFFNIEKKRV